jgi:hypothetical protein
MSVGANVSFIVGGLVVTLDTVGALEGKFEGFSVETLSVVHFSFGFAFVMSGLKLFLSVGRMP